MTDPGERNYLSGVTPASVATTLFALLLAGIFTQYFDIVVSLNFASEHTLALPCIWTFLVISLVVGVVYGVTRIRLVSRAELLCVMYAMLIGAPLMTQGFWHRVVAVTATNPRQGDFEKMDAFNDRLWPHGPNLIQGMLSYENRAALTVEGTCVWEDIEYEEGRTRRLPVLVNQEKGQISAIRITLPLRKGGRRFIAPGEPYMVSVLAHATDLGPDTTYYCRAYNDVSRIYADFFQTAAIPKVTFLHRRGFRRVGAYGVRFSAEARDQVFLEFALKGNGRVALADPKLFSVAALEQVYRGRMVVTQAEYDRLPPAERANLLVKPDRMWTLAGLRFLLCGYIPVRAWIEPMFTWTSFILLLLLGTLAINIVVRRQWLENERYLMPVTRIPVALMDDGDAADRAFPPIWRNRLMWAGFVTSLLWVLMKAWHYYNTKVPDVSVNVRFAQYLTDPGWGGMWSLMRYEISGIFLALCMFMELNVLISLVVGYFLFKCQYWFGYAAGLTVNPNYPYAGEQAIGAYLGYAAAVIFFTRKYLWRVIRAAVCGGSEGIGEALSYRWAVALLALTVIGSAAWARWLGIAPWSMIIFFLFLLAIGLVCSKIRAECGTPWGYFAPGNLALFMVILGGVSSFGGEAMLFCYVASFMLAPTVFYLIPGAQMELLELGRRWRVRPHHLAWTAVIGILGGMLIGGWVFLSNAYALGGDTMRYGWAFDTKWWYFFSYNQDMAQATNQYLGEVRGTAASWFNPAWVAFGFGAVVTMILSVLRQMFAGFWFHPIGFVLGSSNFMDYVFGSALTAWVIRGIALRLGGAATVRNKLQPFFIGVFLGEALGYLLLGVHGAYLRSVGIELLYPILTP